eukprot:224081-Amphidinium_carterae.1
MINSFDEPLKLVSSVITARRVGFVFSSEHVERILDFLLDWDIFSVFAASLSRSRTSLNHLRRSTCDFCQYFYRKPCLHRVTSLALQNIHIFVLSCVELLCLPNSIPD